MKSVIEFERVKKRERLGRGTHRKEGKEKKVNAPCLSVEYQYRWNANERGGRKETRMPRNKYQKPEA